jgi:hypothetical protein
MRKSRCSDAQIIGVIKEHDAGATTQRFVLQTRHEHKHALQVETTFRATEVRDSRDFPFCG